MRAIARLAIWGWLAFVVLAMFIGSAVGTKTLEHTDGSVGESGRADQTIADAAPEYAQEMVLIQSGSATAADPAFRAVVADAQRKLEAIPDTQNFESPLDPAHANQVSADGHAALLRFQIAGKDSEVTDRVKPAVAAIAATEQAHPGFTLGEFGDASTNEQIEKVVYDDFGKALKTSLPVTLIILLFAFGALVAAGVPLLLAITAVMGTIGIMGPLSHVIGGVDNSINEVILLIGLAVGVDYSMFYLRREREEREAGRSEEASLAAAAATSGRAVMVSGFTVMIAMAGMYFAGTPTFQSFATGTILVVAVALVGSLTVLPAILSWLGDRVEKGGVPILKDQPWNAGESRIWNTILDPVLRHPGSLAASSRGACWSSSRFRRSACTRRTRASSRCPRTSPRSRPTTGFRRPSRAAGSPPSSWSAPTAGRRRRSGRASGEWWRRRRRARCSRTTRSRSRPIPTPTWSR